MTKSIYTTEDYDNMSWHDNIIHSISIVDENYESNLILGIDFITEWICENNKCQFLIAPAKLVFHDVKDFQLVINKKSLIMNSYLGLIIDKIIRESTPNKDKTSEHWRFKFCKLDLESNNCELSFVSTGFTQTILKEPILKNEQTLIASERI